jgi:hypothetical protein
MKQNGSDKEKVIREAAKKYVDDQLEVLKKHGSVTRLSKTAYDSVVNQVVRVSGK